VCLFKRSRREAVRFLEKKFQIRCRFSSWWKFGRRTLPRPRSQPLKTVLIVEDNAVNRELLRELLSARDFVVEEAENGLQALEMMKQRRPDILLLDLNMPVLDGFGTLRKLRENADLSDLPVLAVTASAMRGDEEKALEAGFNGYLSKPVKSKMLFQELDRLLRKD
jgi:CheY-like chemotaxis protein